MLLQAVRGSTQRCSEAAEGKVAAAGGCAQPVHLQQMRSSAPQPQDIPFAFRTLWSLGHGQASGQWAGVPGKRPSERGSEMGRSPSRGCAFGKSPWAQEEDFLVN